MDLGAHECLGYKDSISKEHRKDTAATEQYNFDSFTFIYHVERECVCVFSISIHFLANSMTSVFFTPENHFIVFLCQIFPISSPVNGHLS